MSESVEHADVGVVVPAAGKGRRLGGERKQFRRLGEDPVLIHTLRRFTERADVHSVVVPTGGGVVEKLNRQLAAADISARCRVVVGGDSRQASVAAGLEALSPEVKIVLVHDAVRPFVTPDLIQAVIEAVRASGAAAAAIPVADTVRRATDGRFEKTIDRRNLYRMQTPQGFRRDWLEEAHREAARKNVTVTDDVALVQRMDRPVQLVQGHVRNIKITTPADWELAQLLWKWSKS